MLIFLDIDGVMVPAKGWKSPDLLDDGFPAFGSKAVSAINSIIAKDTTIMLTTSHKANFTVKAWKDIFRKRGIDIKNLKCLPENIDSISRKDEIINWHNLNNTTEEFIIIDDDKSLNDLPEHLKKHLVETSPYIGLNDEHLEMVKSMLHQERY